MTTRILLHVGMHKTGTTGIQRFLAANRPALADHGVLYPVLFGHDSHPELALCLPNRRQEMIFRMRGALPPRPEPTWPDRESAYSRLAAEIRDSSSELVVVSSECFMEWVEPADIQAAFTSFVGCPVTVLVYLRNQPDWLESVYRQVVRDPEIRFAGEPEDLPQWEQTDYLALLRPWVDAFGSVHVRVRSYDTVSARGVGSVRDLLGVLGIPPSPYFHYPHRRSNAAATATQTAALRDLNRSGVSDRDFEAAIRDMIGGVGGDMAIADRNPGPSVAPMVTAGDYDLINRELEIRYFDAGHRLGPARGVGDWLPPAAEAPAVPA